VELVEAKRRVAADQMNAMPSRRKRLGELGCDDAAAAYRRVADDADVHAESRG
jgi:hypothetical protein